jgi:hypothetical protein
MGMGHGAWGMGYGAWGMGHGAMPNFQCPKYLGRTRPGKISPPLPWRLGVLAV